jgi:hypothetical protein
MNKKITLHTNDLLKVETCECTNDKILYIIFKQLHTSTDFERLYDTVKPLFKVSSETSGLEH